ncbi:DUF4123 domain-containing protein [Klebsiella michiganensis]|uniref:DUF4123 domain-containing protein n=1 Tax=Klebsiella michiganensis TaxID=1134687 RepID=UPI00066735F6|nr:DUF4123 domain-containing protein [Klebsiella michiganensis]MBA8306856.1 DUF4123 domain-containing protein [Klebsiella michiganensis]MDH1345525.1 DUF4123 domain-containing protein [Klebsiella michiganensis]QLP36161.1 DUF4123 domain-containing protein [Klebsiella michiganensis]WFX49807.1 DUF4123 domain-containing protein [Klebsiella michiganensis]WFX55467.1 DUF4123 domain-containing protein [Klebsiella michiganensis]
MSNLSFSFAAQHLIHSSDVSVFALVDGLQYERFTGYELKINPDVVFPLFNTWPDSRIAFAGPWLIRMNETMEMRKQLEALEIALPGVSWIVSGSTPEELVAHLQIYMNTGLPDGRAALLRFQDPRVQVRLGTMLNDLQHQKLTGLMQEWLTIVDGKVWSFKQREFIC